SQLNDFIARIPGYFEQLQGLLAHFDRNWLIDSIGVDPGSVQEGLRSLLQQGAGFLAALLQSIWNSGKAIIDIAGLFVVTPVVAFYMLLDWDKMVAKVD